MLPRPAEMKCVHRSLASGAQPYRPTNTHAHYFLVYCSSAGHQSRLLPSASDNKLLPHVTDEIEYTHPHLSKRPYDPPQNLKTGMRQPERDSHAVLLAQGQAIYLSSLRQVQQAAWWMQGTLSGPG
jgi:hypothetical protein